MQPEASPRALPKPTILEWLCLAGGMLLVLRYAWLLDDAFVFFRYVDNLVFLDRGLVFNEGEFVEGFSSPLWTLVLVPLRATGMNWWMIVRLLGMISFVGFWLLLVALRGATVERGQPVLNLPLLYLAFLYGPLCYFTSGMETGWVQVLAVAYALHVFRPGLLSAQILVGLSPMVRHELALAFLVVVAWDWWRERRFPSTTAGVGIGVSGAYLLFRIWYYADLFPNTFYLKDGTQISWGLTYVHDTLVVYGVYVLAPALLVLALLLRGRGEDVAVGQRLLLLAIAAMLGAYVIKIGGDGRHYRYLAFPFCLAVCASAGLPERALAIFAPRLRRAGVTTVGIVLALVSASFYPRELTAHPLSRDVQEHRVGVIRDAQFHRATKALSFSPWGSGREIEFLDPERSLLLYTAGGWPPPGRRVWLRDAYSRYREEATGARRSATISDSWCVRIWQLFNLRAIHRDGLTDPILARTRATPWRPGHLKDTDFLASHLAQIQTQYGWGRGIYRRAVEDGVADPWIARNLESIERIERKTYNRHDLIENLVLAVTPIPRLEPPPPSAGQSRSSSTSGVESRPSPGLPDPVRESANCARYESPASAST